MIASKLKRYSLFGVALISELLASFAILDVFIFPLIIPSLLFCEIMLFLELSNLILLLVMSISIDFLCGEPVGKYSLFIFVFSFITLFLRPKILFVSPVMFWVNFILLYSIAFAVTTGVFLLLGYAFPTLFFVMRAMIVTPLLFLPILGIYAYSFSRRQFVEGRYVKR